MYDIVYFVKDARVNEELKYSLRSVEKNFEYRNIWFYGGCPDGLKPDKYQHVNQNQPTKWERVQHMIRMTARNKELSENFYLFNDDFFIMKPWEYETYYYKDLYWLIVRSEGKTSGPNGYSRRLRQSVKELEDHGCDTRNYALHTPLLLNKKKVLKTLDTFPDCPMFRSLYGNLNNLGGTERQDCKIITPTRKPDPNSPLLSTSDKSFRTGEIGKFIRSKFKEPSRYEINK